MGLQWLDAVERSGERAKLLDVLDRVLDKGIVIDAWVRVSLVGIDLVQAQARIIVASIETYLTYAGALGPVSEGAQRTKMPTPLTEDTRLSAQRAAISAHRAAARQRRRQAA